MSVAVLAMLSSGIPKCRVEASNYRGSLVDKWNGAVLHAIRDSKLGAPMAARALAIVHTCLYDAWAAYDNKAVGTQLGSAMRRPASERTLATKRTPSAMPPFAP